LITNVIKPGFERAYPQYRLDYVSKGTGAAIQFGEQGAASGLLVHAATLENQFVAQGYSLERFGRAVFYGDYVLLGPASDPAGVARRAPHDIVGAFELIARAGAAGRADFVSRGGTPGTTVEEHQIWALTRGVALCEVSMADGGGRAPSGTNGTCATPPNVPQWYHATGLTQGPNIQNAAVCSYGHGADCYVLTDRGTFAYLESQRPPLTGLRIVTRDNAGSARGGPTELVNSFHAYGLQPAKLGANAAVNVAGVRAFLDYLTSPRGQAGVRGYLRSGGDAPFLPDAAPRIELTNVRTRRSNGRTTVNGRLVNAVPGTPALARQRVAVVRGPAKGGSTVAATMTAADGRFVIHFRRAPHDRYTLTTGAITQIEEARLRPVFGDLLAPASRPVP
jgi:tungstate transport system substrate-binding protein